MECSYCGKRKVDLYFNARVPLCCVDCWPMGEELPIKELGEQGDTPSCPHCGSSYLDAPRRCCSKCIAGGATDPWEGIERTIARKQAWKELADSIIIKPPPGLEWIDDLGKGTT